MGVGGVWSKPRGGAPPAAAAAAPALCPCSLLAHRLVARHQHVDLVQDYQRAEPPPPRAKRRLQRVARPAQIAAARGRTGGRSALAAGRSSTGAGLSALSNGRHTRPPANADPPATPPPHPLPHTPPRIAPGRPQPLPAEPLPQLAVHVQRAGQLQAVEAHKLRARRARARPRGGEHLGHAGGLAGAGDATHIEHAAVWWVGGGIVNRTGSEGAAGAGRGGTEWGKAVPGMPHT